MQDELIDESNIMITLADEIESLLEDIFLSGFHGIRQSTIEKLTDLYQTHKSYGMEEGCLLLTKLREQLIKFKDSFHVDIQDTMKAYSQVEFYLEHIRGCLRSAVN